MAGKCYIGTGRFPGSLERTLFSAAVLRSGKGERWKAKVKVERVEAEGKMPNVKVEMEKSLGEWKNEL